MGSPRFFCDEVRLVPGELRLPEDVAHHAVRVLRLAAGDELVLFDGQGNQAEGRLIRLGQAWGADISGVRAVSRESPLRVVLVQALAAADKMDWVIQKAVELGVSAIQPVSAERSVIRLSGERAAKRATHWQQVAVAACEQCGRNTVPMLFPISSLADYLSQPATAVKRFVLDPVGGVGVRSLPRPEGELFVHLLIGPEGGWSERELTLCRSAQSTGLTLGPRVLRTETAGLAVIAAMQALWGDF